MLIIEMAKIEVIGGHIGFMLIIEMTKKEINPRPYWILLIIEMAKIEIIGGHFGIIVFI